VGYCPGTKPITQKIQIDDGTGKKYTYELTKYLDWVEYDIVPGFSTDPIEPTILDETSIIPSITDTFDVVGYSYKDWTHSNNDGDTLDSILPVDWNFYEDGTQLEKGENETVQQILSVPRTQDITQTVRYFTGWEVKDRSITKTIQKTNLPPEVCNTLDASCYTVPTHLYTTCSTDYEDVDPTKLVTDWKLYIDRNSYIETDGEGNKTVIYDENNADWELLETKNNSTTFYWVYSEEGRYRIFEETTDTDGASSSLDRYENIVFAECDGSETNEPGTFQGSGEIEIEANKWQLVAMPLENNIWDTSSHDFVSSNEKSTIYNCVVIQLEDRYNTQAKDLFKVANAYFGDIDKFYNYIPGIVSETSEHNFPLVYIDEDDDVQNNKTKKEITGFWIKAKDMNFTIKWKIV